MAKRVLVSVLVDPKATSRVTIQSFAAEIAVAVAEAKAAGQTSVKVGTSTGVPVDDQDVSVVESEPFDF